MRGKEVAVWAPLRIDVLATVLQVGGWTEQHDVISLRAGLD